MPRKGKLYCGNSEELPKGYKRFGTRFECLKKGYGSALVYSTDDQRTNAINRMMSKPPSTLSRDQLAGVAQKLSVSPFEKNGKKKTKENIINDLINRLKKK
jgi:hypothetical protein